MMRSSALYHVVGGGIFVGTIYAEGGLHDTSCSEFAAEGRPVLQVCADALSFVGLRLIEKLCSSGPEEFEGIVLSGEPGGKCAAGELASALARIAAGSRIEIAECGQSKIAWSGNAPRFCGAS